MLPRILPSANRPQSNGLSIPAPVGGWNARDSIALMPQLDAVYMDNWFPEDSSVRVRPGSKDFASIPEDTTSSPHNIRSLMPYRSTSGDAVLFAAADDGIYDISAGGEQLSVSTPATNSAWESVNMTSAGGSFLFCCNGVDEARVWNGTNWTILTPTSTPPLTGGLASSDIINVTAFKARLYLCEKDSLDFWYLPVNSFAGEAKKYPMGAVFKQGGHLVSIDSWTIDGGSGMDDFLVLASSVGEIAVFQGFNPETAQTWALVGLYYIGRPLSKRCFTRLGGDLALLTSRGLFPLSEALQAASVSEQTAISDKIRAAWSSYIEAGTSLFGWQTVVYPEGSFLLVNIPVQHDLTTDTQQSYQFVMNLVSGAWCRFIGMPSEVWATHDGKLYFAQHNKVYQAWVGADDAGRPIDARVKPAFFYPSGRGALSQITLLKPLLDSSVPDVRVQLVIDTDYTQREVTAPATTFSGGAARWDEALWDESTWGGASVISKWRTVFHMPGKAISLRLRILNKGVNIVWNATEFILKKGGLM